VRGYRSFGLAAWGADLSIVEGHSEPLKLSSWAKRSRGACLSDERRWVGVDRRYNPGSVKHQNDGFGGKGRSLLRGVRLAGGLPTEEQVGMRRDDGGSS
jgi:hypothetical protein